MRSLVNILFNRRFFGAEICTGILSGIALGLYPDHWTNILIYTALTYVFVQMVKVYLAEKR